MTSVLTNDTQRKDRGEGHVKTQAENGVMHSQIDSPEKQQTQRIEISGRNVAQMTLDVGLLYSKTVRE